MKNENEKLKKMAAVRLRGRDCGRLAERRLLGPVAGSHDLGRGEIGAGLASPSRRSQGRR